ncbi:MAG TPA: hypothetical protein VJN48_09430 [Terriglobales bacterium]|nr:hypothetical protein [Terriglobales bacterium]
MPKASTQRRPASEIDEAQVNRDSRRKLLPVMAGFAVAAFLITELLHYLLVPDLGPYRERIMAEGGSALILGMLAAKLLHNAYKARQYAMARLRVIAELNHHVRNALEVISLSAYITRDEEAIRRITEGVNRIDWALREILPRESFPIDPGEPPPVASAVPGNGATTVPAARGSQVDPNPPVEQMSGSAAPGAVAGRVL